MNFVEFQSTCARLEMNFDRQLPDEKAKLWFEKIKSWSRYKFSKVVEGLIEEQERFPALAAVLKAGQAVYENIQTQKLIPCDLCDSSGMVHAEKEGYKTAFRCPSCTNWSGKYSEKIPLWDTSYREKGYKFLSDNFIDLDHTDPLQIKGLKMIQDVSPKIFAKTLAREPRFKQVLGVKEDQKETEKPEQKMAKEQLRQESLRRDSMRDLMGMEYEM